MQYNPFPPNGGGSSYCLLFTNIRCSPRMGRRFRISFALVLSLGALFACGEKPVSSSNEPSQRSFALFLQTRQNPVFEGIEDGLQNVIHDRGDRLEVFDARFSSAKQHHDILSVLERAPDAIFINPVNWEGIRASLIAAHRSGVPVVVVDAPVSDPDLVLCQVASDNATAGRLVCQAIAAENSKAKIAILHLSLNRACIDRVSGFQSETSKYPGMEILTIREGKGRAEGSYLVMKELLRRYPELNAVFAVNDPSALGAIRAIKEAGLTDEVKVVSVDGSPAGIAAIRSGELLATALQLPNEIGRIAADRVYDHLEGKKVARNTSLPVELITAETLPLYETNPNKPTQE